MPETLSTPRPFVLGILCGLGFAGCFLKMILVISPVVQAHGRLYAVYLSLSSVVMIVCLSGLWLMKRWAFWAFLTYVVIDQIVYWQMGYWDPKAPILQLLILLAGIFYYRKMRP
jgi:hypothetical protein